MSCPPNLTAIARAAAWMSPVMEDPPPEKRSRLSGQTGAAIQITNKAEDTARTDHARHARDGAA